MLHDTLCLSGGGIEGLTILGSLKYIVDKNILKLNDIKKFVGTSVGSIICFFINIGYDINTIINIIYELNLEKVSLEFDFENLIENYGIDNGSKVITIIQTMLYNKYELYDITFNELYDKTTKELLIISANYSKKKEVIFSYKNYPNLSIILALRMSISIPFIFNPVNFNNDLYVDGGLINNFGIEYCCIDKTIGICLENSDTKIENFFDYCIGYFNIFNKFTTIKNNIGNNDNIIILKKGNHLLSNFNPNKKDKLKMVRNGYKNTKQICKNNINLFATKFINNIFDDVINNFKN